MPKQTMRIASRNTVWVTGAKGPVVHAYHELRDLAQSQGKRSRSVHEAAVTPAPAFQSRCGRRPHPALCASLFREALPAAIQREGIRGLTSDVLSTARVTLAPERKCRCGPPLQARRRARPKSAKTEP